MSDTAVERCLLVDYENVRLIDLAGLADDMRVTIFIGAAQKCLPFELVQAAQRLGERLEWIKVDGSGNNALDFLISYFLGCILTRSPETRCFILSKDTGFDPMVRHLNSSGLCCRRVSALSELDSRCCEPSDTNYTRVLELLRKHGKKSRPRRRTTLTTYIAAMFQPKLPEPEALLLVERLFAERKVSEDGITLSYAL